MYQTLTQLCAGDPGVSSIDGWPVDGGHGLLVREEGQWARVVPGNCSEGKGNEKQEAGGGVMQRTGGCGRTLEEGQPLQRPWASRELMAAGAQCGWR